MTAVAAPFRVSTAPTLNLADAGKPTLAHEIAALAASDKIDEELEEMKRALAAANDPAANNPAKEG